MPSKEHWERVYSTNAPTAVSWYQEHAALSFRLIEQAGVPKTAAIIDVGGGASTLVDDLLRAGYRHLSVLDLSGAALQAARARLGKRARDVTWIEADIRSVALAANAYDVWHDRAVFHFLTADADRRAYVRATLRAVKPGGHVIVATFAEDGPPQCSGLPVVRYNAEQLHAQFGKSFTLVGHDREAHHTPFGTIQEFTYCYCRTAAA